MMVGGGGRGGAGRGEGEKERRRGKLLMGTNPLFGEHTCEIDFPQVFEKFDAVNWFHFFAESLPTAAQRPVHIPKSAVEEQI